MAFVPHLDQVESRRSNYDHYNRKLTDLRLAREKRTNAGKMETADQMQKYQRNVQKYEEAKSRFVRSERR